MRFSDRTDWPEEVQALTARYEALRASGQAVLDLTVSNPTRCGFRFYDSEFSEALADEAVLHYGAEPFGSVAARHAVAACYQNRGLEVRPERVLLTASTSEAYAWIYRLMMNPAEQVAVPSPSYPLFDFLADCNDVRLSYYHLDADDDWRIDLSSLESVLKGGARIITLVSPNNPTGSMLMPGEREAVVALAEEYEAVIVSDEVFADYPLDYDGAPCSLAAEDRVLSFTLGGLSKSLCLPQMKLGWMVVGGPEDIRADAMRRLEVIADTYLSVGAPVQAALPAWLKRQPDILEDVGERLTRNLACLRHGLSAPTCSSSCDRVDGGWSAVIRVPSVQSDEEWAMRILEECGVLVHPGGFYGFAQGAWLVVSLLTPEAAFQEGMTRLLDVIDRGCE